jgi:hypothetical protein
LIKTGVELSGSKDVANCDTPLAKYETSKKIHLCSKLGALKKAYPKLLSDRREQGLPDLDRFAPAALR